MTPARMRVIGALLLLAAASPTTATDGWRSYANARFGVAVEYPAVFSQKDAAPANGDGQVFRTRSGDAVLTVYGSFSPAVLGQSLSEAMAMSNSKGVRYTYQRKLPNGYVLSSLTAGERITYLRCTLVRDTEGCMHIEYPANDAKRWDPIVSRISRSLRIAPSE